MHRSKLVVALAVVGAVLVVPGSAQAAKTVTPGSLTFPGTAADKKSPPQVLTVGIGAADSPRFTSPSVDNCSPGGYCDFHFTTTCPKLPSEFPAATDQTCTFSITFEPYDPFSLGLKTRSMDIGPGWPSVTLTGTSIKEPSGGGKKKKCRKKGKKGAAASEAQAAKKKCGKKKGKGKSAAAAKKKKKKKHVVFKTGFTAKLIPVPPPPGQSVTQYTAQGTVTSPKAACRARTVVIIDPSEGTPLASGSSGDSGAFTIGPFPSQGTSALSISAKKIGGNTCARTGGEF